MVTLLSLNTRLTLSDPYIIITYFTFIFNDNAGNERVKI